MKNVKTKLVLGIMLIMLLAMSSSLFAGTYSGGSGTSGDPYQIATTEDLIELSNTSGDWGAYFEQTADIAFNADENQVDWDGDGSAGPVEGFSPIGNSTTDFSGTYDGQGHTIDNIYINRPSRRNVGFFAYVIGAVITNLGVINVDITGEYEVGGLAGGALTVSENRGSINQSYSTGNVSGEYRVGGLVARNASGGTITESYSECNVTGEYNIGGLVYQNSGTLEGCYSTGNVTTTTDIADNNTGGLASSNSGTVNNCYSTCNVSGKERVGGLVATNNASINSSYFNGTVLMPTGDALVGGIVAMNYGSINQSNSKGTVTVSSDAQAHGVGGLVGENRDGAITENYSECSVNAENSLYVGGLIGRLFGGSVSNSHASGNVTGNENVGGLVGYNDGETVSKSYSTGDVSGIDDVGGLIGENREADDTPTITESYSKCNVDGDEDVGGLIGRDYKGMLSNSYATGNVTGEVDDVGGLIGHAFMTTVNNSYSTGSVSGTSSDIGGLIGYYNDYYGGSVNNSFWDTQTSGQESSAGDATGKTTTEMKDYNTFFDAGWDFMDETTNGSDDYWGINSEENNGYPFLEWQGYEHNPPQAGNLYISEVSDNQSGKDAGTGFIELWNDTGSEVSLNGYSILQGTNNGSGFVAGSYSYSLTDGYTIPADGFFVIGNGADLSTFNTAWGLSLTTAQYDSGNSSLQLTNGHAYALDDGSRAIIDETEEVGTEQRIYQASAGSWTIETPTTGTPGGFGGDQPLPVTLSTFNATYNNEVLTINWATESEENNAGWNIYRGTEEDALENDVVIQINDQLIAGAGTTNNITEYSFIDEQPIQAGETYWYWLEDISSEGETVIHSPTSLSIPIGDSPEIPLETGLHQNYPNPFNPSTTISFTLTTENTEKVEIEIFNMKGQKIRTYPVILSGAEGSASYHSIIWDGKDENGKAVSSGVYYYKLNAGKDSETKKMLLLK